MKKNAKTLFIAAIVTVLIAASIIALIVIKLPTAQVTGNHDPITIGFVGPLSGDAGAIGQAELDAATIAATEINSNDGINGRLLRIIPEDGKCNGKDAVSAIQKLITVDHVKIILGGTCSGETLAMAPLTEEHKIILFSSSSSNPAISDAGTYIFRNSPTDNDFAPAMAEFIARNGYKRVAIISENTEYAMSVRALFKIQAAKQGTHIVADEVFASGSKDLRAELTKIKDANPDALFINPQDDTSGGLCAKQARELGITAQFYSAYYLSSPRAIAIAGSAVDGTLFLDARGLTTTAGRMLLEKYREEKGTPVNEYIIGASYDRVYILKDALMQCGIKTDCIKNYMYNLKEYHGTIGDYGFTASGDMDRILVEIKQVSNGSIVDRGPFP